MFLRALKSKQLTTEFPFPKYGPVFKIIVMRNDVLWSHCFLTFKFEFYQYFKFKNVWDEKLINYNHVFLILMLFGLKTLLILDIQTLKSMVGTQTNYFPVLLFPPNAIIIHSHFWHKCLDLFFHHNAVPMKAWCSSIEETKIYSFHISI